MLDRCTSRSGYANDYKYKVSDRALLRGSRVGGILGYGVSSVVRDCSTKAGGYVLGGDYVGGIAGALSGSVSKSIQAESVSVTTNASYVIGNNYVGGIVGTNRGDSTISSCVNTGVTAGYGRYIGGIVGANASIGTATPVIRNCASYISDTNSSIYRMVLGWNAVGSYAGGLARLQQRQDRIYRCG